jgi:hypothetical protein
MKNQGLVGLYAGPLVLLRDNEFVAQSAEFVAQSAEFVAQSADCTVKDTVCSARQRPESD